MHTAIQTLETRSAARATTAVRPSPAEMGAAGLRAFGRIASAWKLSALMLETSGAVRGISQMELATEVIPSSEIRYLALQRGEHSGAALGAFIGLAAGVALVVIAISSATGPECAADLPPGILFGLQQRGLGVSTQPYDRFAGRFIDPARGTDASSRHAAPTP